MTEYRRAYRPADRRLIAGVSAGLADHLQIPVIAVRISMVLTTVINGVGVVAYLVLWRLLPLQGGVSVPGLDSATRRGMRSQASATTSREIVQGVAIAVVGAGLIVLLQLRGVGLSAGVFLPLLVAAIVVVLMWRQYDDASLGRWMTQTRGLAFAVRVCLGVMLVALAGVYILSQRQWSVAAMELVTVVAIAVIGFGLILGPWLYGLVTDLNEERRARMRSQERADVAAHLHDSVLQTLALLQKNPNDSAQVATLARRQERELRSWLYGDEQLVGGGFAPAVRTVAIDVETSHQVPVNIVVVGDAEMTSDLSALIRAAREAMVNSAKHAGVESVDVYAEIGEESAEIFVRDRGCGFDRDAIAEDRMGVRDSIIGRIERHGGTASIKSVIGEGSEVQLVMPIAGTTAVGQQTT